jgi:hypothetical protein
MERKYTNLLQETLDAAGYKSVTEFARKILFARVGIDTTVPQEREFLKDNITDESGCTKMLIALLPDHTKEDAKKFVGSLDVLYYNGFGSQEVFGDIALADGQWLSRKEYDGSEEWALCYYPSWDAVCNADWNEEFKECDFKVNESDESEEEHS